MSKDTNISWTDATFNPWWGCDKVSPGCKNCYADSFAARLGLNIWGPGSTRRQFSQKHWKEPLHWNDTARRTGNPYRVFCGSMCDVFEDHPISNEERERLWSLIRLTPLLTWQLLTKRADRIKQCLPESWGPHGYGNVWIGVSAENQEWAQKRVPLLLDVPAKVRFLSVEPMLGPLIFDETIGGTWTSDWSPKFGIAGIGWVIFGGESGANRRPCDLNWILSGVNQCQAAEVPVFVKQDSALKPGQQGKIPDDIWKLKQFPRP